MMLPAGYRSSEAILAIQGMKILTPIALVILVLTTQIYRSNPFLVFLFVIVLGYIRKCGCSGKSRSGSASCALSIRTFRLPC